MLILKLRCQCILAVEVFLVVVTSLGCSSSVTERVVVQGAVTYLGNPIDDGTISFIPLENSANQALSAEIVAGRYTISTDTPTVSGRYCVKIQAYQPTGKEVPNLLSPDRNKSSRGTMQQKKPILPEKFNNKSEIVSEITSDNTTLDFNL